MATTFAAGDRVQTPFGKGVVREVRNNGRLLVEIRGCSLVVEGHEVSVLDSARRPSPARRAGTRIRAFASPHDHPVQATRAEVDLHGLTVEASLLRVERALSDALLADLPVVRFIHGRSGGRIRSALHQWLRHRSYVRGFQLDPGNSGVTVVQL